MIFYSDTSSDAQMDSFWIVARIKHEKNNVNQNSTIYHQSKINIIISITENYHKNILTTLNVRVA